MRIFMAMMTTICLMKYAHAQIGLVVDHSEVPEIASLEEAMRPYNAVREYVVLRNEVLDSDEEMIDRQKRMKALSSAFQYTQYLEELNRFLLQTRAKPSLRRVALQGMHLHHPPDGEQPGMFEVSKNFIYFRYVS